MERKHIITIAGRPGSGKSTTAKSIAKSLGYNHFSSGDLFRNLAKDLGIDVLQANISAELNAEIDHLVDGRLREIGKNEDKLVIDSRTAWHWIPNSFKVFLDLDLQTAATRILDEPQNNRADSELVALDPVVYATTLKIRLDSETRRYKKLYDIDPYDMSNYNLVVDTAANDLKQVVKIILQAYKSQK